MKIAFLYLAILIPASMLCAQQPNNFLLSQRGQFIALSVKDAAQSSNWYQNILGFTVIKHMVAKDSSSIAEILKAGDVTIEIVQQRNSISKNEVKKQPDFLWQGIFKTGFFVTDLQYVLDQVKKRNVPIFMGPVTDLENKLKFFMIRDYDGNILQFFEEIK